ncbi:hypothetical protein HIM_07574 [Hirsutella minnesotensis 3608]|uniref:Uncharacterized protein n=1 Tax=Hirsutella minnesotensis 3608 TaxID=1043627 RepID=A0A0F7ZYS9_9HYPO|nr:hypothetical protein HIM_07574 [Hirsutella minnesotensis 3608]
MPVVALWILHGPKDMKHSGASKFSKRFILGLLFLLSTITHIGAFSIAGVATWIPSMFGGTDLAPLHISYSLLNVPEPDQLDLPYTSIRQARLRQINEMIATSSGFFMAAGIFWQGLEARATSVTPEIWLWMFLVSLIAGPAAGSAVILLFADFMVVARRDGQGKRRLDEANRTKSG